MRASPSPGEGRSTYTYSRTSGSPNSSTRIAFICDILLLLSLIEPVVVAGNYTLAPCWFITEIALSEGACCELARHRLLRVRYTSSRLRRTGKESKHAGAGR